MQTPLQVTFRQMSASEALRSQIEQEAAKLDELFDGITSCRVSVSQPHHHHRQGNPFHVTLELHIPGHEIVVNRDSGSTDAQVEAHTVVTEAFDAARRQLQDAVEKMRAKGKRQALAV